MLRYITTEALSGKKETRYFWNYPNKNLLLVCMRWSLIVLFKLIIVTASGKIYIYREDSNSLTLLDKTLTGSNIKFANFLRGIVVATESDEMFYIKDNNTSDIASCKFKDKSGNNIYPDCICIYQGRLWCAKESTVYYSALGTYDNFELENDAGYINDFHTDTNNIIGMQNYKEYLAIYKKDKVYLLSGSNPSDFAVTPFADKGYNCKQFTHKC